MEAYKPLGKLYYGDTETYQQVYEARFSGSGSIHLQKAKIFINLCGKFCIDNSIPRGIIVLTCEVNL